MSLPSPAQASPTHPVQRGRLRRAPLWPRWGTNILCLLTHRTRRPPPRPPMSRSRSQTLSLAIAHRRNTALNSYAPAQKVLRRRRLLPRRLAQPLRHRPRTTRLRVPAAPKRAAVLLRQLQLRALLLHLRPPRPQRWPPMSQPRKPLCRPRLRPGSLRRPRRRTMRRLAFSHRMPRRSIRLSHRWSEQTRMRVWRWGPCTQPRGWRQARATALPRRVSLLATLARLTRMGSPRFRWL